jgi:hypothetical protein
MKTVNFSTIILFAVWTFAPPSLVSIKSCDWYDGVTSFRGNKDSQVNYTKNNWFYAMKLLCRLKMGRNFIYSKFGAKILSISLGNWSILVRKMCTWGRGWVTQFPCYCYKNSSYRCPSQQIGLKLQIWEEEVQRHIYQDRFRCFEMSRKLFLRAIFWGVKTLNSRLADMNILIDMPIFASHGLKILSKSKQNFQEHCKINYIVSFIFLVKSLGI